MRDQAECRQVRIGLEEEVMNDRFDDPDLSDWNELADDTPGLHQQLYAISRRDDYDRLPISTRRDDCSNVAAQMLRAKERGLEATLTEKDWFGLCVRFHWRCAYCGAQTRKPVIEHVIPICQGGGTTPYNCVPSCRTCNASKRANDPIEWDRRRPGVLEAFLWSLAQAGVICS